MNPIKSQEDADMVYEYIVTATMGRLNIDRAQSEKRVKKLMESDVFKNGNPKSKFTQMQMDEILSTPVQ